MREAHAGVRDFFREGREVFKTYRVVFMSMGDILSSTLLEIFPVPTHLENGGRRMKTLPQFFNQPTLHRSATKKQRTSCIAFSFASKLFNLPIALPFQN